MKLTTLRRALALRQAVLLAASQQRNCAGAKV
jgi:hypothetical protein